MQRMEESLNKADEFLATLQRRSIVVAMLFAGAAAVGPRQHCFSPHVRPALRRMPGP